MPGFVLCRTPIHWAAVGNKQRYFKRKVSETDRGLARIDANVAKLEAALNSAAKKKGGRKPINPEIQSQRIAAAQTQREVLAAERETWDAARVEAAADDATWNDIKKRYPNSSPCCALRQAESSLKVANDAQKRCADDIETTRLAVQRAKDKLAAAASAKPKAKAALQHDVDRRSARLRQLETSLPGLEKMAANAAERKLKAEAEAADYRDQLQAITKARTYPVCGKAPQLPAPPQVVTAVQPCSQEAPTQLVDEDLMRCFLGKMGRSVSPEELADLTTKANTALGKADISDSKTAAIFLANCSVESNRFSATIEGCDSCIEDDDAFFEAVYGGRGDLGNLCAGDGAAFRGRGYMQTTGRDKYVTLSKKLGRDFVSNPEAVSNELDVSWEAAAIDWRDGGCNDLAKDVPSTLPEYTVAECKNYDKLWSKKDYKSLEKDEKFNDDFNKISRRINGGYNGWSERRQRYVALTACMAAQAEAKAAAEKK